MAICQQPSATKTEPSALKNEPLAMETELSATETEPELPKTETELPTAVHEDKVWKQGLFDCFGDIGSCEFSFNFYFKAIDAANREQLMYEMKF